MPKRSLKDADFAFYRALMACAGTPLENAARDVLTPMVVRESGELARTPGAMARALAWRMRVSDRSARRLLAAYGWSFGAAKPPRRAA